jgi:signal transduction histidine kinase
MVTLRQRLILWSIVAVILPAFASTLLMSHFAERGMADTHAASTLHLAKTVAGALENRLDDGFGEAARAVVDRLREDPRVALVELADPEGNALYRPINDPEAYTGVLAADLPNRPITTTAGVSARHGHYALSRVPILERVDADGIPRASGYLTIGIRDRDAVETLNTINVLQVAAAVAVCLLTIPLTILAISRWTAPLEKLRVSVEQLAQGRVPTAIPTRGRTDLNRLCEAFNAMVRSLVQAQDEISRSNARLEMQVQQRTAELRHLNDKLEIEGQDKNEFLRAVSHDLNAPLRNIGGMAQMLLMKHKAQLPEDAVGKLERIAANAKHQGELIGDLLELSRLRTKQANPEAVELEPLLRRIIDNLEYDLSQADIRVVLRGKMPTIWAEKNRVRQVLQNLLDNAIKYMMDATRRQITVSVRRTRDYVENVFEGVDVWEISVADTGRGIAAEDLDGVFQVFSRSTHSGTHVVAGRGVGLASVKTIVESYGGRIWVESTLGAGATFSFTLPVDRVAVPDPQGQEPHETSEKTATDLPQAA